MRLAPVQPTTLATRRATTHLFTRARDALQVKGAFQGSNHETMTENQEA